MAVRDEILQVPEGPSILSCRGCSLRIAVLKSDGVVESNGHCPAVTGRYPTDCVVHACLVLFPPEPPPQPLPPIPVQRPRSRLRGAIRRLTGR